MLVTAKLQHAHILSVLTAGARDGLLYYVTPFVAGDSLRHRITLRRSRSSIDEVPCACCAKSSTHSRLRTRWKSCIAISSPTTSCLQHGHAILADFGIARVVEQATRGDSVRTRSRTSGSDVGTPGYMCAEQLAGRSATWMRARTSTRWVSSPLKCWRGTHRFRVASARSAWSRT